MQYEVIPTPKFEKDLKKIGKKDKGIADELEPILEDLEKGKMKGKVIPMSLKVEIWGNLVHIDLYVMQKKKMEKFIY